MQISLDYIHIVIVQLTTKYSPGTANNSTLHALMHLILKKE